MAKKEENKSKVYVKNDTAVFINGRKIKVKKGTQELDKAIAQILIEAKEAEAEEVK